MRRVIVGTAGHIDHGKTKLVEALTGIDCDRWIEEKERGITIDLGFAFWRHDDFQIGFIDVPGHERFVHNALAGLGGIRIALLVIAADEGVKQQTREHLEICSLLAIPACMVALTKTDLVAADLLELAHLEVEELLADTPYAEAEIMPVSSKTGDGISELRHGLLQLAEQWQTETDPERTARVPIDRAFHLKGLGVVVTGTLVSGSVVSGDNLQVLPGDARTRVRNVQVHGESRQRAETGERTALQLSGVDLAELHRGVQLAAPNSLERTTSLLGSFDLLPGAPKVLKGSTLVRFHLYASEVQGRIRPLDGPIAPGRSGMVEIRLLQPVAAVRGDRFIARRPSPPTTLGGGRILDPNWHRHRGSMQKQALTALDGDFEGVLEFWVREAQDGGIASEDLAHRLGESVQTVEARLEHLASDQKVIRVPSGAGHAVRWITPDAFQGICGRAEKVVGEYFKRQRLAQSMPKAEAVARILPGRAADLADTYLEWLQAQKILRVEGDSVNLPGRTAQLTGDESKLAQDIRAAFDRFGLQPPSPKVVQDNLRAKTQIFDGVVGYLLDQQALTHLPGGLLISSAALQAVIETLQQGDQDQFSVGEFKSQFGLTRKWAIPILEHLDSSGVTRRIGDRRQIVRTKT